MITYYAADRAVSSGGVGPWQVATGLTLVIVGVSAILLLDRLDYLGGYWGLILGEHPWAIAAPVLTALASVFAATHWVARKAGAGLPRAG